MTALFNDYMSSSSKYEEPKWMREERYMYCEPMANTTNAIWSRIKNFSFKIVSLSL